MKYELNFTRLWNRIFSLCYVSLYKQTFVWDPALNLLPFLEIIRFLSVDLSFSLVLFPSIKILSLKWIKETWIPTFMSFFLPAHNPLDRWFVRQIIIHSQEFINAECARPCIRSPLNEEWCKSAFWEMCCWETLISSYWSLTVSSEKAFEIQCSNSVILQSLDACSFKHTNNLILSLD